MKVDMNSLNKIPETALIPIIKKQFLSSIQQDTSNFYLEEEFKSCYGIPDVVFYNFNQQVIKQRLNKNIHPVLSKQIIKTLLFIEGKNTVSMSLLENSLPISKRKINKDIIKFLVDNEFLLNTEDIEIFKVNTNLQLTTDDFFSIEAKISNWKRGFYQAYRYKWFSNISFLALHKQYIKPALVNYSLFEEHNIGLAMIDTEKNQFEVLHRPKQEKPYSKEMTFQTYEKLFSNYLEKKILSM